MNMFLTRKFSVESSDVDTHWNMTWRWYDLNHYLLVGFLVVNPNTETWYDYLRYHFLEQR